MFFLTKHLLNNVGYLLAISFGLTYINMFKQIMEKEKYNLKDKLVLSILFSSIAMLGTYAGAEYNGAIANTRNIGVVVSGILGGPLVGLITGLLAGLHRYLIDPFGITSIPCAIASSLGGVLTGIAYQRSKKYDKKTFGFIGGIFVENMSMIFILLMSSPFYLAKSIVSTIYIPMVLANGIGAFIVISITESILKEKDRLAGEQASLILEVANKTLPHFRDLSQDSLINVCHIIRDAVGAKLVAITDTENIVANYSSEEKYKINNIKILSSGTRKVLKTGEFLVIDNLDDETALIKNLIGLNSALIVPLTNEKKVVGTLKLYFKENSSLTSRNKYLAIGLSQLISTQLEIRRMETLKNEAAKAEIKALQAQINPHFLFNALHTVASFVRIDPNKARSIIIDLSTYLRYSIENTDRDVTIEKELEQVKAYIGIEKARFPNKFKVHYDIEEGIESNFIPNLTIQPLVENAIKHGILKQGVGENVYISIFYEGEDIKIVIEDDGVGIEEEIIKHIQMDSIDYKKIGLYNVHSRVKLIYGKGLFIERLSRGTRISFSIRGGR